MYNTLRRSVGRYLADRYHLLPERLRMGILVRRRCRIWRQAGIIFVHIPKAAGTSINLALYGQFMGHARASDIKRWAPAGMASIPTFAVTRNPWDRLVSAYRFAKLGRGVGGRHQAGVWRPERYHIPEFETFERFVCEWLAERDISRLDNFFQPQWRYVCDSCGNVLVDHLGQIEDLRQTVDFLREALGTETRIGQSNSSGESLNYRDFYTPQLADLVGRIYAIDVAKFGYTF